MATELIRPAAVAGLFYPSDTLALTSQLHDLMAHVDVASGYPPKALIVPHAGYVYSGPIAAQAYAQLLPLRQTVTRVVMLGPSHRVPVSGAALPGCNAFETPLGRVEIDGEAMYQLANMPGVVIDDDAHVVEHALEVQLPFLQTVLERFRIVPITVGFSEAPLIAAMIDTLWGGSETLFIISSDLSHYNDYRRAREIDAYTVDRVMKLEPVLDHEQACGATAINALMLAAQRHHLTPHLLDVRNSGDTAGDRSRVVGYASFSFSEAPRVAH
ncbi:MAG: AmmeMemoRadiSam system protein B [Rhodocyclaceae bacterium]